MVNLKEDTAVSKKEHLRQQQRKKSGR